MDLLSRAEELILLAIWQLQTEAYGVKIRQHLSDVTGSEWAIGSVYVPLDRLTKRGLIKPYQGAPTPERGGKSKRFYELTTQGIRALAQIQHINAQMWAGIPRLSLG